jgi:hypothetical protein
VFPAKTINVINAVPSSLAGTVGVITVNAVDTKGFAGNFMFNKCAVSIRQQ